MTASRYNIGWIYQRDNIDPQDIHAIAREIRAQCDDVHLYPINGEVPNNNELRNIAKSPCLFFCQGRMAMRTTRGKVYNPKSIPKFKQARIFAENGLHHPVTAVYDPTREFSESEFGDIVMVKPSQASRGRGIFAMETRLVDKYRDSLNKYAAVLKSPIIIQEYIDTGDHIEKHRVLLLFGAVIYALTRRSLEKRPVSLVTEFITDRFIQSHGVKKSTAFCHDPEILETAKRVAAALPEIPIIGVDLIREAGTGKVFVVEANIGNTWHLSSKSGVGTRKNVGGRGVLEKEFRSWEVAAGRLIELARAEAR